MELRENVGDAPAGKDAARGALTYGVPDHGDGGSMRIPLQQRMHGCLPDHEYPSGGHPGRFAQAHMREG
jgi:hypothetical protein